jgi:ariadne-1
MIYSSASGSAKQVECSKCKYRFCWACKNESHFPSSCNSAGQWLTKCSSEAENIQWILAKTNKRCPKCKVHIEKNQGCNHMTCRKHAGGCGYEFCWLCKGDWTKHGRGYYYCNIYKNKKVKTHDNTLTAEEKTAENAQNELDRYEFHYTRFDSHHKSCKHAIKQVLLFIAFFCFQTFCISLFRVVFFCFWF